MVELGTYRYLNIIGVSILDTSYDIMRFTDLYVDEDSIIGTGALIYGSIFRPALGFNSEEYVCREQDLFGIEHHLQLLDVRERAPDKIGLETKEVVGPILMISPTIRVCTKSFRKYSAIKIDLSNENTLFLFF